MAGAHIYLLRSQGNQLSNLCDFSYIKLSTRIDYYALFGPSEIIKINLLNFLALLDPNMSK